MARGDRSTTLVELLNRWQQGDPVEHWRCDECKEVTSGIQKVPQLKRLGDHVMIEISRTGNWGKNNGDVRLPGVIDMGAYMKHEETNKPDIFEVAGIIEHSGKGYELPCTGLQSYGC